MAVISFADSDDGRYAWVAAGSRFRQVLDEVIARCPRDPELVDALESAIKVGYLYIQHLDAALGSRVRNSIRVVAYELMRPGDDDEYVDEEIKASLHNSMAMLLKVSDET